MKNSMDEKSKYYPLYKFLLNKKQRSIALDRDKIEDILRFKLPKSSQTKTWWGNTPENGHYHAYAWVKAGFTVRIENELIHFTQ